MSCECCKSCAAAAVHKRVQHMIPTYLRQTRRNKIIRVCRVLWPFTFRSTRTRGRGCCCCLCWSGRAGWRTAKWLPHRMKILHTWAHVSLWNCRARRVDTLWRKCSFFDWSLSPSLSSRVVPRSDDRPSVTCTRMDCLTATHPHWLAGMKLIGLLPLSDLKNHLSTENYTITLIKMVKGLGAREMKEDLSN